jgi:hypothetical protein
MHLHVNSLGYSLGSGFDRRDNGLTRAFLTDFPILWFATAFFAGFLRQTRTKRLMMIAL